jgi:hypothetical protein
MRTRISGLLGERLTLRCRLSFHYARDGGQNIIGPELRERLGVIRTEELLAARPSTTPSSSFHAIDFIFQTAAESMRIWDRQNSFRCRLLSGSFDLM